MKKGFPLRQLTDIYCQEMMPYLRRTIDGVMVRLDSHYTRVMRKMGIGIDEFGVPITPTPQQEALQKKLFGDRVIDAGPPAWYEAEAFLAAEKMPHEWDGMPIESRARWMAARRIQGMQKTLERYREVMDQRRKDMLKGKAPNKPRMNRRKR